MRKTRKDKGLPRKPYNRKMVDRGFVLTGSRQTALTSRADFVPPQILMPKTKWLPLLDGRFALVDEDRFDDLNRYSWRVCKGRYGKEAVCTQIGRKNVFLHRMVANLRDDDHRLVDHKNGDTFDNREENLRPATAAQSSYNTRKHSDGTTSKYKGVSHHESGRWQARICVGKKLGLKTHIGYFDTEIEAAEAYDALARERCGEFACVNFPREGERSAI